MIVYDCYTISEYNTAQQIAFGINFTGMLKVSRTHRSHEKLNIFNKIIWYVAYTMKFNIVQYSRLSDIVLHTLNI